VLFPISRKGRMVSIEELIDCGRLLDRQENFAMKKDRAENLTVLRPMKRES
jgi:hypothetical protein